jgi:hypothetical protein
MVGGSGVEPLASSVSTKRSSAELTAHFLEGTPGFEPRNSGFAIRRLNPLGYVPTTINYTSTIFLKKQ